MGSTVETLGEKIRRLRLERGMSQAEIADGFVTVSMISQIERDRNTASIELLQHIAKKLQIPLHVLVRSEVEQMEAINQQKLVKIYLQTNQSEQAELLLVELRRRNDLSQADIIDLTIDHAECMIQQGKYDQSLEFLTPLVTQMENNNFDDAYILAKIRNKMGNAYYHKLEFTPAYYNYQKAYDLIGRFGTFDQLAAYISYNVGNTLRQMGHGQKALLFLERAYSYFRNVMDIRKQADTLFTQGRAFYNSYDLKRSAESYEEAYVLYKGLNLVAWAVKVQHSVAVLLKMNEDMHGAISALEECAEFYLNDADYLNYILVLAKLAEVQMENDPKIALEKIVAAERLIEEHCLQNKVESAVLFRVKSKYHLRNEEFGKCLEEVLKSADLFAKMGLVASQVDSLEVAVDAYEKLGNFEQALKLERERNRLLKKLNPKGELIG
ncbi:hypothetical protein CIG75_07315 [Tumebacillus algifaecis]|uniref:HTH cro/C1-type domain-containing protein n=1 Tax=Tumebacillus algifaecis TaxID=1214604 RepID=A0A223CZV5_9BACL|nr:helix-turn-helix transcriptional regulator [Tumebacillus algifaecis]ASS74805.1 hypothetical protein CIG75_07315 [Tumebacillus algifaecis]